MFFIIIWIDILFITNNVYTYQFTSGTGTITFNSDITNAEILVVGPGGNGGCGGGQGVHSPYSQSLSGDLNDNLIEVKDDLVLDVLDIMSQSYVDTFEEETEEDTILDVVDIIPQT